MQHQPRTRFRTGTPRFVRGPVLLFAALAMLVLAACNTAAQPNEEPAANEAPVATAQTVETREGTPVGITLAGEDPEGASLDYTVVEGPTGGTLEGTAPNLTYVPASDFLGADSFTFTVSDGEATSDPATVAIEVVMAPFYAITRGSSTVTSSLYYVDESGTATEVGDLGHALVSIKFNPTDGVLYGTTRSDDTNGACNNCLVTIDTATAATTVVGTLDADGDPATNDGPVPSLAFTSDGTLYGWTETGDDLVQIDEATGAMTVIVNSGLSTYGHGMFTDASDTLWFINGDGNVYTIDPADGSATLVYTGSELAATAGLDYSTGDLQVRGDLNPATGLYAGASTDYGNTPAPDVLRLRINADVGEILGTAAVDPVTNLHNLAYPR